MKRIVLKGKNALINTAKSLKHSVTHPKETAVKLGKYIKENPDEAVMVIGSNVVPGAIAAKKAKEGDAKSAAMWTAAAAAPIGESYVIGKKGIKALLRKSKSMSDRDDKEDLRNVSLKGFDIKDQYKAKAAYVPVTVGTYVVGRSLAKKMGASNVTKNFAPLIPAIAAGRLTKKAVIGRLKSKGKSEEQKEFANLTNVVTSVVNAAKNTVLNASKSSTGIASKSIAKSAKTGAENLAKISGDAMNSFKTGSKTGMNTYAFPKSKPRVKQVNGPELPFEGGIDTVKLKPKIRSGSSNNISSTSSIPSKQMANKHFDRRNIRLEYKDQRGPEELVKQTNTKGASRIINNGMIIPGFGI